VNPTEITQVGPYPVRRFISEGGMAWVFEVTDPKFNARRALKMLKPEAAGGEQFRRFEAEARVLARIDHPNLVTIYDFGVDEATGCYYYTMTYVDGPNLGQKGVLPPEEAIPVFLDVLAGLAQLHDSDIVHRDIKPANILLTRDGRALLADLGIARTQEQTGMTRTGMAIGTVIYMSPEQARGKPVGPASDVFSVGLSLYQVLCGRTVYDDVSELDVTSGNDVLLYIGSLVHSNRELRIKFPDSVPAPVRDVILRCCRFDAGERYPDARAVHGALIDALETLEAPPQARVPWVPIVGAGTLLVAALAVAMWWLGGVGKSEVEERLGEAEAVEKRVFALVGSLSALEAPPSREDLFALRREADLSEGLRKRGAEELQAGNYDDALSSIDTAIVYYERLCRKVVDQHLSQRADEAAGGLRGRVEGLAGVGAKEESPERWAELEAALASVEAKPRDGSDGCDAADHERQRIDGAASAATLVAAIEKDLARKWPEMAAAALAQAEQEQKAAEAERVEETPYRDALARGRKALAEGKEAGGAADHLAARAAYDRAAEAFRQAQAVVPAARARSELRRLEAQAAGRKIEVPDLVSRMVAGADEQWAGGGFEGARADYAKAIDLLSNLLSDAEKSQMAFAAAGRARAARESAQKRGAESSAREAFAAADALYAEAQLALEERRYPHAEQRFREAEGAFAESGRNAQVAADEAREARTRAERAKLDSVPRGCASLAGPAKDRCEEGEAAMRDGEAALAAGDAASARVRFDTAADRFAEAKEVQATILANQPKPPTLRSRTPSKEKVAAGKNEKVALQVEASDPNGDPLLYNWFVNDSRQPGGGSSFELEAPPGTTNVRVVIDDGRGGTTEASWTIDAQNRKPSLALDPREERLQLEVGSRKAFVASAKDPDGDPVLVEFLIDGNPVAQGDHYEFSASKPGQYNLTARATDPADARATVTRRIEVVPKGGASGGADGAKEAAMKTLRAYEAAFEARDMNRLANVWTMNPSQRSATERIFNGCSSITLTLTEKGVQVGPAGDQVLIDFDQRVQGSGASCLAPGTTFASTATLKRSGDRWVISSIGPRR
jgi:serine/threonine protein kinase